MLSRLLHRESKTPEQEIEDHITKGLRELGDPWAHRSAVRNWLVRATGVKAVLYSLPNLDLRGAYLDDDAAYLARLWVVAGVVWDRVDINTRTTGHNVVAMVDATPGRAGRLNVAYAAHTTRAEGTVVEVNRLNEFKLESQA